MFGLNKLLRQLKKQSQPSRQFKDRLLVELKQMEPMKNNSVLTFRYATVGVVALILVFGMGTGVYAYESPEVVEGHPLNFVKKGLENVGDKFANSPEQQARFHAKMIERRLKEAERHGGDEDKRHVLLERASEELDLTLEEIRDRLQNEDTKQEMKDQLAELYADHQEVFAKNGWFKGEGRQDFENASPKRRGIGPDIHEFKQELAELDLTREEMHEAMKEHMDELLEDRLEKIKELDPENYDDAAEQVEKQKEWQEKKHEAMQKRVEHWREKSLENDEEEDVQIEIDQDDDVTEDQQNNEDAAIKDTDSDDDNDSVDNGEDQDEDNE